MRSQPQLRNDTYYDVMHKQDKFNSFPALAFELLSSMARALDLYVANMSLLISSDVVSNTDISYFMPSHVSKLPITLSLKLYFPH